MKAMILAAGRGKRLRELTAERPKPLLPLHGKALIVHHLEKLAASGFKEIVINHAYLGDQIEAALGDGRDFGLSITYSPEEEGGYETGGGIKHALPLLGDDMFAVINADIWTDYPFAELHKPITSLAHLVLVNNPAHNPSGDFAIIDDHVYHDQTPKHTFAGIGIYHPDLFKNEIQQHFRLADTLRAHMPKQVTGELYQGVWSDVGTPERYFDLAR